MKISRALRLCAVMLVLSAALQGGAQTEKPRTPIEVYRGDTSFELMQCTLKYKLAAANARLSDAGGTPAAGGEDSDFAGCIRSGERSARSSFDKAFGTLRKPQAREALKAYHVAFVTALKGIAPGMDERRLSYEQRQQALQDKVTEAWARFELEK